MMKKLSSPKIEYKLVAERSEANQNHLIFPKWCARRESPPERPKVRPEGVEPPTYSSVGCRSIQLSYGRKSRLVLARAFQVLHRNRSVGRGTPNPQLRRLMLYPIELLAQTNAECGLQTVEFRTPHSALNTTLVPQNTISSSVDFYE